MKSVATLSASNAKNRAKGKERVVLRMVTSYHWLLATALARIKNPSRSMAPDRGLGTYVSGHLVWVYEPPIEPFILGQREDLGDIPKSVEDLEFGDRDLALGCHTGI